MIGQGADVGFNREFTMQVQDAQKALISDTAIHSNERLSPFTPIERGHLVSYSRKTRPRLTSQPSWVGASPPFRGKSVATVAARLYDPNQAQGNYENWRKACRRPHKLDDPGLNAWVKRLFLRYCCRRSRSSTACATRAARMSSVTQPSTAPLVRAVSMTVNLAQIRR